MQRIVIATDLSDVVDALIDATAKLAIPCQASVYVVYCQLPHDHYAREEDNDSEMRQRRRNADAARDALRERGVTVAHCQQLCTEDVVRSVLLQLERFDADLLVIGSRPHGRIRQYLGDQVRDKLLQKATCPVLVVKGYDTTGH